MSVFLSIRGTVLRLNKKKSVFVGDFVCFYFLLLDIAKNESFLSVEPKSMVPIQCTLVQGLYEKNILTTNDAVEVRQFES